MNSKSCVYRSTVTSRVGLSLNHKHHDFHGAFGLTSLLCPTVDVWVWVPAARRVKFYNFLRTRRAEDLLSLATQSECARRYDRCESLWRIGLVYGVWLEVDLCPPPTMLKCVSLCISGWSAEPQLTPYHLLKLRKPRGKTHFISVEK